MSGRGARPGATPDPALRAEVEAMVPRVRALSLEGGRAGGTGMLALSGQRFLEEFVADVSMGLYASEAWLDRPHC